jgi:flagellar biosynthesis protein FliQ
VWVGDLDSDDERLKHAPVNRCLVVGDIVAILVVTLIGFATHGEADLSFLPRMAAMFFPLAVSWFMISPFLGLFQKDVTSNARQLWRPALAMIFAAPLAAVLRGFILNAPIIPIFAVVLAATSALGMVVWRGVYLLLHRRSTT